MKQIIDWIITISLMCYCTTAAISTNKHENVESGSTGGHSTTATSNLPTNTTMRPLVGNDCSKVCARTYSPHTSTKGMEDASCNQGCRLFSIISATNTQPLEPCKSDCEGSYDTVSERNACSIGCESQVSEVGQKDERFLNMEKKFMREAFIDQMMTHWMFQMISGFDWFNDMYEAPETLDRSDYGSENVVIISSGDDGIHISDITILHPENTDNDEQSQEDSVEFVQPETTNYDDEDIEQDMYYGLVNFNSNMLFCLLVFFSSMMLFWLSCNIITTSPKQRSITKRSENMKMAAPLYQEKKGALLFVAPPPIYTEKATLDRNSLI